MDFIDKVRQFASRVENTKNTEQTEEATKTGIIMPFFAMLGYDVFNPEEFVPEMTCDVPGKKGEKVDYAIRDKGNPVILIEVKKAGTPLEKHDAQLFRYYSTTTAKFGILTNGIHYRFYSDLDAPNKMDLIPFMEFDILNMTEFHVAELKKFHKTNFNLDEAVNAATELKYAKEFKTVFSEQLQNPSDDFVRIFITENICNRKMTKNILDKFRPILKKTLNQYITEIMNERIKAALADQEEKAVAEEQAQVTEKEKEDENKIVTTSEELEACFIVRSLLRDIVPVTDITYKDTESYFAILYQNNTWKWICRLILSENKNTLILPTADKKEIKYPLANIYEIEKYKDQLVEIMQRHLTGKKQIKIDKNR